MPRTKKTVILNASDEVIEEYFDLAVAARDSQRELTAEISELNVRMADDGVDPGTLAICRKLAAMKPGKRGISVALLHRYLQVLASRLEDPTMPAAEAAERPLSQQASAA